MNINWLWTLSDNTTKLKKKKGVAKGSCTKVLNLVSLIKGLWSARRDKIVRVAKLGQCLSH